MPPKMPPIITREELKSAIDRNEVSLVETLRAEHYEQGHLPGAIHIHHEAIGERADELLPDKQAPIVTYCANLGCRHSEGAANQLTALGCANVRTYQEGKLDWMEPEPRSTSPRPPSRVEPRRQRTVPGLAHSSARGLVVRRLGAILLLFVGADHYYEYSVGHYSVVPKIGTLFLLNFLSATVIGVVLLAPLYRLPRRLGGPVLHLAALSGFAIAATSLVALLVSEQTHLLGFMELNYRPAVVIAIVSEAAAAAVLALLAVSGEGHITTVRGR